MSAIATLSRLKPSASLRVHLLAAALMWTVVGVGLGLTGLHWCLQEERAWIFLGTGLAVGTLKGLLVMSRVARRNARRIRLRGNDRCLGGFQSWQSWIVVAFMMGMGWFLRHSALPRPYLGILYTAVGMALMVGGCTLWKAWHGEGRRA